MNRAEFAPGRDPICGCPQLALRPPSFDAHARGKRAKGYPPSFFRRRQTERLAAALIRDHGAEACGEARDDGLVTAPSHFLAALIFLPVPIVG
jgi:hypothetical protein